VKCTERLNYSEHRDPGAMGFLTVRERHIDLVLVVV
jgi:hypothetical protein